MEKIDLACRVEERRKKLFDNPDWNGMDFLEVSEDPPSLCVHFFGSVPETVTVRNVRIDGGRRIRDIKVVRVEIDRAHDPELDDCLRITLDKFGDFSTYRLCLVEKVPIDAPTEEGRGGQRGETAYRPLSGLDPRYACIDFSFKVDCPSDLDCKTEAICPPETQDEPEINYLAKDYTSFRQLIFDRLALTLPDWRERHAPDIGVMLVELLAYVADYLSYYQDAVATEAYLDTARRRVSVRRHVRLVDYRMHEGCNARAWVTVATTTAMLPLKPGDFYFITGFADVKASSGGIVREQDLQGVPRGRYEVFEPLPLEADQEIRFYAAHSEIRFYTWGDEECCLPKGATRATLLDERPATIRPEGGSPTEPAVGEAGPAVPPVTPTKPRVLHLQPGDVLIFEEVLGPATGNPADADPAHRHAVRLTKVTRSVDGLLGRLVLEIEWAPEDALPFSLCLSVRLPSPDCRWIENVSVARGNVVLVDHGRIVQEPLDPVGEKRRVGKCACEGSVIDDTAVPEPFRPALGGGPLTFGEPLSSEGPASMLTARNPRRALPRVSLRELIGVEASGPAWTPQYDLLASGGDDRHFVAEIDDNGRAQLRFGDGELGLQPAAGSRFEARYRVGNGPAGNVGRETINYLVLRAGTLSAEAIKPRNPLPARGGADPEPVAEVKLFAPNAFRNRRERAITAGDYAEVAERNPQLQRAAAELRWTGSWYEARVAVDPVSSEEPTPVLLEKIEGDLFRYRRMGHDLTVVPARYVPLVIELTVCVLPHYLRGHVEGALLNVFSNGVLPGGRLGFFHPDNLTFGEGIYLSRLVAAAQAVPGVESAQVTRFERFGEGPNGEIGNGLLTLGPLEIAQLDNDPSFPENGTLKLTMGGGR